MKLLGKSIEWFKYISAIILAKHPRNNYMNVAEATISPKTKKGKRKASYIRILKHHIIGSLKNLSIKGFDSWSVQHFTLA